MEPKARTRIDVRERPRAAPTQREGEAIGTGHDSEADSPCRTRDTHLALWDWRRQVDDLYGAVRTRSPEAGWRLWREGRDALFRHHPQTPLDPATRDRFVRLPVFPHDPALRFTVALGPVDDRSPREVAVGRDGTLSLHPFARTEGFRQRLGGELTLFWIGGYGGGVFLPFMDATSGRETYGGGRYLLDTIKGADLGRTPDGHAILDFNFAYNPSCAYSPEWVCPLAPPENRLAARIEAGERRPDLD